MRPRAISTDLYFTSYGPGAIRDPNTEVIDHIQGLSTREMKDVIVLATPSDPYSQSLKMSALSASTLFSVNGMNFVVTGGGSGLGEMMALALDANGASKVFILGRRQASLEKVAAKAVSKTCSLWPLILCICSN